MTNTIAVNNIFKKFGDIEVLKNVSFTVKRGEIFGLLGPSGAGKTTLLKILTGQLKQDQGVSKILGTLSTKLDYNEYSRMGLLLDDSGLYLRLTCYQNLKIMQILYNLSSEDIVNILKEVDLYQDKDKSVLKLSKGMHQRLAFARALIHKPEILFLDEPTSGLDPVTTTYLHDMILELAKNGTTIILTTHNMDEATKLCDNVGLLHEGNIIEYGSPEQICRRYSNNLSFRVTLKDEQELILSNSKEDLTRISNYLLQNDIVSIHSQESTLLSIFVSITGKELE